MFTLFGLFLLLAFVAAYFVFRLEYRRKEAEGFLHPFPRPTRMVHPLCWGLLGFVAGAKIVYWWLHRNLYLGTPPDFIFSTRGNGVAGLVVGLIVWQIARRQSPSRTGSEPMHPYQLMDYLLLYCGLFGFAGAILFAQLDALASGEPFFTFHGLNYYGGLIAGALTYLYINKRYGIRPAMAADIGSPGMMLAYAIGRMGCHVAGDGDWGIINNQPKPGWVPQWLWASRYPHNSVHQGLYIPGCTGSHCTVLTTPVYPTPLYEALICLCLFLLLWKLRRTLKKPGILFAYFAILNGAERFCIEFIRINPRYEIGYWNLSQAQVLALGWMLTGLIGLLLSTRKLALHK
ncbi:MAG: prolipoprotein diacylglyceryl transferase [Niastella sp.]|uniref:prolipoprotein diacylglyceryl transferase n=1 Tax=Niastella sp. TaxID=1869183 RepID=UPI00389A44F9